MTEREEISRGVVAGSSLRSIATSLGRAPSTISREIRRNGGRASYRANRADQGFLRLFLDGAQYAHPEPEARSNRNVMQIEDEAMNEIFIWVAGAWVLAMAFVFALLGMSGQQERAARDEEMTAVRLLGTVHDDSEESFSSWERWFLQETLAEGRSHGHRWTASTSAHA